MKQIEYTPKSTRSKLKLHFPKRSLFLPLLAVVMALILSSSGYFLFQKSRFPETNTRTQIEDQKELTKITSHISQTIELPDEQPTLATVSDKSKLQDQPFFRKAENGDKVLFYTQAAKAILYRPSTKKIIDFTTIRVSDEQNQANPPLTATQPPSP